MTPSPSHLVWCDAGCPDRGERIDALCFICGASCLDGGGLRTEALSDTFTDWDYTRFRSDYLCSACRWMMNGKPPDTFRMWSLLYRGDVNSWGARPISDGATKRIGPHTWAGNKADLRPILRTLLEPPPAGVPWACSLADSGKVHVYPFTRVNLIPDWWETRLERATVTSTPSELARVVGACARLLEAGFGKESILSLTPHPVALRNAGVIVWQREAVTLAPYRSSHLLELALFLLRKDFADEFARL